MTSEEIAQVLDIKSRLSSLVAKAIEREQGQPTIVQAQAAVDSMWEVWQEARVIRGRMKTVAVLQMDDARSVACALTQGELNVLRLTVECAVDGSKVPYLNQLDRDKLLVVKVKLREVDPWNQLTDPQLQPPKGYQVAGASRAQDVLGFDDSPEDDDDGIPF